MRYQKSSPFVGDQILIDRGIFQSINLKSYKVISGFFPPFCQPPLKCLCDRHACEDCDFGLGFQFCWVFRWFLNCIVELLCCQTFQVHVGDRPPLCSFLVSSLCLSIICFVFLVFLPGLILSKFFNKL